MGLLARQSDDQTSHFGFDSLKVKEEAFLPIIWTLIAVSFCFLPFRFYARWRVFRRFFWDDVLVLIGWLFAVALGAVSTHTSDAVYLIMKLLLGNIPMSEAPPNLMLSVSQLAWGAMIVYMLCYASLWAIKGSFLLFFYRLGVDSSRSLRRHWWAVFLVTFVLFAACFGSLPYYCSFGGDDALRSDYCSSQQNLSFLSLKLNCAFDVLTDCLIMSIPIHILWRTKIPRRQKLALAGVFSLVIITIIIAIIRVSLTTVNVTKQLDYPWVLVWTTAEVNVVMVACVGSFRSLFVQTRHGSPKHPKVVRVIERTPAESTWGRTEQLAGETQLSQMEVQPKDLEQACGTRIWHGIAVTMNSTDAPPAEKIDSRGEDKDLERG